MQRQVKGVGAMNMMGGGNGQYSWDSGPVKLVSIMVKQISKYTEGNEDKFLIVREDIYNHGNEGRLDRTLLCGIQIGGVSMKYIFK